MPGTTTHYGIAYSIGADDVEKFPAEVSEPGAKTTDDVLHTISQTTEAKKSIIAAEQTRENAAYGLLATPDEATVVLPENGLIAVTFRATVIESVAGVGRVAIFLNENQLKVTYGEATAPQTQAARFVKAVAGFENRVFTCDLGLTCTSGKSHTADATTGQALGYITESSETAAMEIGATEVQLAERIPLGSPCYIDNLPAGTYKVSIRYLATSGNVKVKNRLLRAWVVA